MKKGCLIVVSGPSGAGKGTVCGAFLRAHPEVSYSISATTRAPREKETDGVEYYFLERSEFERMIRDGELLEWAEVYGNYYGTPLKKIEERLSQGMDILLEIDTQGALNVMKRFPDGVFVFILPPSLSELEKRLRGRGTDADEVIARRLSAAAGEIAVAKEYTYAVVNDSVEDVVQTLSAIVAAEHARTSNNLDTIDAIINNQSGLSDGKEA
ncbi:MAG: guanylate kinase [Schwartzia sp.]|nr:guanylate kinase [Schwartzia sp. (in: firmicutes)]MBR5163293.1 guanylate kinase [Schwartzia sp. (in: firmicutes)]